MGMSLRSLGLFAAVVAMSALADVLSWPEATQESKPWVYNWWMGSAVDEKGLEAQCAALAEKGLGGFHVIPIYGAKGFENQYRKFLDSARTIVGPWTLTPVCGGSELPPSRTMQTLSSWSVREDGGCVPFDASDWPLRDSGLLGPVTLVK